MLSAIAFGNGLGIDVQPLQEQHHFQQAIEIQRRTWGYSDCDVIPSNVFSAAARFGGQALGAFDGGKMVALALSFGSSEGGRFHFHSHMVGVLPEYQNCGLGKLIKLAQREDALRRGVNLISWTYDPMQTRNAYFNLSVLGGIGTCYLPNFYGTTSSPLHGGVPTDRMVIEWKLDSPRVEGLLKGERPQAAKESKLIEFHAAAGTAEMALSDRLREQARLRTQLQAMFSDGLAVTGFQRNAERATYILEMK
jgi:predicted GNAT superfamily acetyltransferase